MFVVGLMAADGPVTPGQTARWRPHNCPRQVRTQVLSFAAGFPWKGTLGMCLCAPVDRTLVARDHCLIMV